MARKKKYDVNFSHRPVGNSFNLKTAKIEGELYYSSKDFLKYLLELESSSYRLNNETFVLNQLTKDFNVTSSSFWDDESNYSFLKPVIEKIDKHFNNWLRAQVIRAILESKLEDSEKCDLINNMKNIPAQVHHNQLLDKNTSTQVKLRLFKFQIDEDVLEQMSLNEEDKEVLSTALTHLDVDKISNPKIIELYMKDEKLRFDKRIKLIEKSSNVKALEDLIFNSDNFDIVKAARKRIKELPKSVKYLEKVA